MANTYLEMKRRHQAEVDAFPMAFAFSNEQFEKAMAGFGFESSETEKIFSIGGGGFIRKTDKEAFEAMFEKHEKERQDAIDDDQKGDGYIYEMFKYELANHEYGYTGDLEPTFDALGYSFDEVNADAKLIRGLNKAIKEIRKEEE